MAATTIKLDEARAATNAIQAKIKEQLDIIGAYQGFVAQLQANWGGEGYRAFAAAFESASPVMGKMLTEMNGYNEQIIRLLDQMQEIDRAAARLFDGV